MTPEWLRPGDRVLTVADWLRAVPQWPGGDPDWVHIGPLPVTDLLEKAAGRETPDDTTWRPDRNVGRRWERYSAELWGERVDAAQADAGAPLWTVPGHLNIDAILAWVTIIRLDGSSAYVEARWDPEGGLTWGMLGGWRGMTAPDILLATRGRLLIKGLQQVEAAKAATAARAARSAERTLDARRLRKEGRRVPGIAKKIKVTPRHTRRLLRKSDAT